MSTKVSNKNRDTVFALVRLMRSKEVSKRVIVAEHSDTTPRMLTFLSSDKNWQVRDAVAANPNLPESVWWKLFESKENPVMSLSRNPTLNETQLMALLGWCGVTFSFTGREVRTNVAAHPHVTFDVLQALYTFMVMEPGLEERLITYGSIVAALKNNEALHECLQTQAVTEGVSVKDVRLPFEWLVEIFFPKLSLNN